MKSTYIVSYDLKDSGSDEYKQMFDYIKSYGTWAHITESLWAINTDKSAVQIRDDLLSIVNNDSALFVIKSGYEAAWSSVLCRSDWLQNHL